MAVTRPPRTDAHRLRAEFIAKFVALKLTPLISTNGGEPNADIQCVKGAKPGELRDCWLTPHGERRLADAAQTETASA